MLEARLILDRIRNNAMVRRRGVVGLIGGYVILIFVVVILTTAVDKIRRPFVFVRSTILKTRVLVTFSRAIERLRCSHIGIGSESG